MKSLIFGRPRTGQTLIEAASDLALRASVGLSLAFAHGIKKIPPTEGFTNTVQFLGFPAPSVFAWCAGGAEVAGAILLALGLFTRPAAAAVSFTMGVAFFLLHATDPFKTKELALLYLLVAQFYMVAGAGRFSIDALLQKRGK